MITIILTALIIIAVTLGLGIIAIISGALSIFIPLVILVLLDVLTIKLIIKCIKKKKDK